MAIGLDPRRTTYSNYASAGLASTTRDAVMEGSRDETFRRRVHGTQPLSRLSRGSSVVSTLSVACEFVAQHNPLHDS